MSDLLDYQQDPTYIMKLLKMEKINSQKLKLPSERYLKGNQRKDFEVNKIKLMC